MPVELYNKDNHACILVNDLIDHENDPEISKVNQLVIIDNQEMTFIDPGGNLTFTKLFVALSKYIKNENIKYILASHMDCDVISALESWLKNTQASLVISEMWERFIPHFVNQAGLIHGRVIGIKKAGGFVKLGKCQIKVLPAHFLHAEGNFNFYDPISKILFIGDIGSSFKGNLQDKNFIDYHQRNMVSNKVLKFWVSMVKDLDVKIIISQHGNLIQGKEKIMEFLNYLENLPCGVDLMTEKDFQIPTKVLTD